MIDALLHNIKGDYMIWIIGTGTIALEYAKILNQLGHEFIAVGRSGKNADEFIEAGAKEVVSGGLNNYLAASPTIPQKVIVATNVSQLAEITIALLNYGVKDILVEKPGFCQPTELPTVVILTKEKGANVFLAYNRRFYSSVLAAEKIIAEDGGITSFNFEFTEWAHVIEKLDYPREVFENWFFVNSTHVVDLAFFLGGEPKELSCFTFDKLAWHKPAVFTGAGITNTGALFSYQANWNAPGRWGIEILTSQHRLYLRPMEKLQIQNTGSVDISEVEIDDQLDKEFKPGFYLEAKSFIEGNIERLCSIEQQMIHIDKIYDKILDK